MANKTIQLKYNQAIDNIAYLIVNHPGPLKKLLLDNGVIFKSAPTPKHLSNTVIEQLENGDSNFEKALEHLIFQFQKTDDDAFLGGLLKGAVGIVGGLIKKGKSKRRTRRSSGASQAAAAKRDLERRMQRERAAQRQREEDARIRREAEQRRREAMAAAAKKTNMMLIIGGGIAVLGLGAVLMKSNRPQMPYAQMRPPTM